MIVEVTYYFDEPVQGYHLTGSVQIATSGSHFSDSNIIYKPNIQPYSGSSTIEFPLEENRYSEIKLSAQQQLYDTVYKDFGGCYPIQAQPSITIVSQSLISN